MRHRVGAAPPAPAPPHGGGETPGASPSPAPPHGGGETPGASPSPAPPRGGREKRPGGRQITPEIILARSSPGAAARRRWQPAPPVGPAPRSSCRRSTRTTRRQPSQSPYRL